MVVTKSVKPATAAKPVPKPEPAPAVLKKAPKPVPVAFDVEAMAGQIASIGQLYQKVVAFDHSHVAVCAYVLIWDDGSCTRSHSFQTYNGLLTGYLADAILGLTGGVAVDDLSKYLGKLERKGYTACTAPAARKARSRKGLAK